jgi:N-acetylglucosamine kinase-like BadF-type ATPase
MILVADSGSTKTSWLTSGADMIETIGLNPFYYPSDAIYRELVKSDALHAIREKVTQVYFYGSGCSSPERQDIVYQGLLRFFPTADIYVDHDLKAAVIATYDGRKCISCILGTGSNACVYDGVEIDHTLQRGMGYILGDEASGSYFGKKLLQAWLYKELPQATYDYMLDTYDLTKEKILWAVYNEPHANVYMARFAKVLTASPDQAYIEKLVLDGFREFFTHNVVCFDGYKDMPVHFVGSIAYHFRPLLQQVADAHGCELGAIDRQPVIKLLEWHEKAKTAV